jgi:hypothetical protein
LRQAFLHDAGPDGAFIDDGYSHDILDGDGWDARQGGLREFQFALASAGADPAFLFRSCRKGAVSICKTHFQQT